MEFARKGEYNLQDLLDIVRILREPGGCPWDQEQTHQSLRKNLIEETYEVADAIDQQDAYLLCEELGDLLLQVAMHVQIAQETNAFTFDNVCDGICKKLIYRHPHVFGDVEVDGTQQVLQNWDKLKNEEKGRQSAADRLDSVPASLPALMRAEKLQKRAASFGFGYSDIPGAMADLHAEMQELEEAIGEGCGQSAEMGDVLFSAVNVARFIDTDAEEALTGSCNRFAARVKKVEELAAGEGKTLKELDDAQRDRFWKVAKRQLPEAD